MNHLPDRKIRRTIDFDDNLINQVEEFAKKRNFSFSYMVYVLLQQAIKEKTRKIKTTSASSTPRKTEKSRVR